MILESNQSYFINKLHVVAYKGINGLNSSIGSLQCIYTNTIHISSALVWLHVLSTLRNGSEMLDWTMGILSEYTVTPLLKAILLVVTEDHHRWSSHFNGEVFSVLWYYWYTGHFYRQTVIGLPDIFFLIHVCTLTWRS